MYATDKKIKTKQFRIDEEEQEISNAAEVNIELRNEQGNLLIKEERE